MAKPVILQVITRLIVGGAQLSTISLCEALRDHYDVRIACGPQEGMEGSLRAQAAAIAPVIVVDSLIRDISPKRDITATVDLRRLYRRVNPALIHTHSSKAGIVGRLAARRHDPLVHTIHGWGHNPTDRGARLKAFLTVERLMARRTASLIAVSDDVRTEGVARQIGRPEQYEVVPALIDDSPFESCFDEARRHARESLGADANAPLIGWVGRFVPQKDPFGLAEVLVRVLHSRRDAQAILIGDGPLRGDVERALLTGGVGDRVRCVGLRLDAAKLYPAFDVLVHPSRWEGQPRVVREALAAGVPVAASRVEGIAAVIADGVNGWIIEPGDAPAMAAKTIESLDGAGPRAPLEAGASTHLSGRYERERAVQAHLAIYERALRCHSRRSRR